MVVYRNVAMVMGSSALFQTAAGVLGVAMPLAMAAAEWTGAAIGGVFAAYAAGFMIGAWFAPSVIRSVGHIRAYAAFSGAAAALTLLLALSFGFWWWLLARIGFGVCAAALFAVAESWIADATPAERRGAVISAYQVLGRAGLILGPFLITLPALDLIESFVVAGAFLAVTLIPITATRRAQPALPETERVSPLRLFAIAPSAATASFAAGAINTGTIAFLPIWAQGLHSSINIGGAATVLAAVYGVSMLVQWPVGRLSDHVDRRYVIAGAATLSGVFALALAVFAAPSLAVGAALAGLWGAASLSYYAVAVAHATDRSRVEELPAIASGMLVVWAAGAVVGPILAGLAFGGPLAGRGLFLLVAAGGFFVAAAMLWRARKHEATSEEERHPFVNLLATSAELAEIEEPELQAEAAAESR
ncbi:ABC transporter ATP-binding protein [Marinicauda salina]|uniref:ABC transporter ATP-binding protein n=1 Tax=Marinicauda salina TaxID=2135793 RepID=A0A2U2BW82_9PROT|nr:MFS transporter [Marinicauda salina]PWE18276.1 ABC transporter ATP-binding protein [Marinicauda salina]